MGWKWGGNSEQGTACPDEGQGEQGAVNSEQGTVNREQYRVRAATPRVNRGGGENAELIT